MPKNASPQIKSREEQDEAIAEIVAFLRMIYEAFDVPNGRETAIRSLMLEYGRPFYMGERTFAVQRGTPKQCYMNAYKLADWNSRLTYVEGWCHMGLIPIEHAWCIDRQGQVHDSTLPEASGYFGIPFRPDYVRATALRTRVYGIIGLSNRELLTTPVETFLEVPTRPSPDPASPSAIPPPTAR